MVRRDERAQMLLLTAFILAISFIAMSSLSARIDQIPEQAEQTRQGLFIDEVKLVVDGAKLAMDGLAEDAGYANLGSAAFLDNLSDTIAHLDQIERTHGYVVEIESVTCTPSGGDVDLAMVLVLASTAQESRLTVTRAYTSASC